MAKIIKAQHSRLEPRQVMDAKARAEDIVRRARSEAQAIRLEAEAQVEGIREHTERTTRVKTEQRVLQECLEARSRLQEALSRNEHDLRRLALAAAKKLLHAELDLSPDKIKHIVSAVLQRAARAHSVTILCAPEDEAQIKSLCDEKNPDWTVQVQSRMERGGCMIRTNLGEMDASLTVRVKSLEAAMGNHQS